jgi:hypothetical protein
MTDPQRAATRPPRAPLALPAGAPRPPSRTPPTRSTAQTKAGPDRPTSSLANAPGPQPTSSTRSPSASREIDEHWCQRRRVSPMKRSYSSARDVKLIFRPQAATGVASTAAHTERRHRSAMDASAAALMTAFLIRQTRGRRALFRKGGVRRAVVRRLLCHEHAHLRQGRRTSPSAWKG